MLSASLNKTFPSFLPIYLSILSVYLSVCLSLHPAVCLPDCPPTYSYIHPSIHPSIQSTLLWGEYTMRNFESVLHDRCNKGGGMCYPVCGMVHIKEPLLLIGKSSRCGGSGCPFSLSEWSLTICLTPYNRK